MNKKLKNKRIITSSIIILASLGLAYVPIPGKKQVINIVSGTELKEPLEKLAVQFEQENSQVELNLSFQGSQDIINNLNKSQTLQPTIIIPANGELLTDLDSKTFQAKPKAIAKTILVGIAWQERGEILFPDGKFSWSKIEQAIKQESWAKISNQSKWGSFDFVMTNPNRSNSGQLTLDLWQKSNNSNLNSPQTKSLFSLIKQSVYQPPRSTDILLQEFITRGANDADVATVYESIALHRWSQAKITQGKPYQIYYPNPTIETVATAAIVKQNTDKNTAKVADKFLQYLTQAKQQEVFVEYGFRSVISNFDLLSVQDSPWTQNIPGVMPKLNIKKEKPPTSKRIQQINDLWNNN